MSDTDDQIKKLEEQIVKDAELERLMDEVRLKKATLDQERYTHLLAELEQSKKELDAARKFNFGSMSPTQIAELQTEFKDYIKASKTKFVFIDKEFERAVPFFRKNLILIAAHTGKGKSTVAANIAASLIVQKNPITGRTGRCLIITNEEKAEDMYARVACILMGKNYTNHNELTDEQVEYINTSISALGSKGLLTIASDSQGSVNGLTTTLEGIQSILENLLVNKEYYDAIIIDYYQNVSRSKNDPMMDSNTVQTKLTDYLKQYKNHYPAPIIMMAQCKPKNDRNQMMFSERVAGRKIISDAVTFSVELTVDYDAHTTEWEVHKSRYTQFQGKSIFTGFENGKYVPCDEAFRKRVMEQRDRAALKELDKMAGAELKEKMENQNGSTTSDTSEGSGSPKN